MLRFKKKELNGDKARSVLASSVAVVTCSALMLPATSIGYAYAEDAPESNNGENVTAAVGTPTTTEQIEDNLQGDIVDVPSKDDGIVGSIKSLFGVDNGAKAEPTGKSILVKRTFVDRNVLGDSPTEEQVNSYDESGPNPNILFMQADTTGIYDVGDEDYYVAFVDPGVINGTGKPSDLVVANNNTNGEVIAEANYLYDADSGILYLSKSMIDGYGDEDTAPIQTQLYVPTTMEEIDTTHTVDVTVSGTGLFASSETVGVNVNNVDNSIIIPVASSDEAANLSKTDFEISVNGGEYQQVSEDNDGIVYDPTSGQLALMCDAPMSINQIGVKVNADGYSSRAFAAAFDPTEFSRTLPNVKYTSLDTTTLKVGDYFWYDADLYECQATGSADGSTAEANAQSKYVYAAVSRDTGAHSGGEQVVDDEAYKDIANGSDYGISSDASANWGYGVLNGTLDKGVTSATTLPGAINPTGVTARSGSYQDWTAEGMDAVAANLPNTVIPMVCVEASVANSTNMAANETTSASTPTRVTCGARIMHVYDDDSILVGIVTPHVKGAIGQGGYGVVRLKVESSAYIELQKATSNSDITDGNSNYSLSGAVYGIYTDPQCTQEFARLTTNADGYAAPVKVKPRTEYYVKEITPSNGYANDTDVYVIKAMEPNSITRVNGTIGDDYKNAKLSGEVSEIPTTSVPPSTQKLDRQSMTNVYEGGAELEGAEFTYRYYQNSSQVGKEPTRTWVVKTDVNGYAELSEDYLIASESDDLYLDPDGNVTIPIGVLTVQETKAPEGYFLNSMVHTFNLPYDADVAATGQWLLNEGSEEKAETDDQVKRGDYQFVKIDDNQQMLANVPFLLSNDKTGEAHIVVTDENGMICTSSTLVQGNGSKLDYKLHSTNTNKNDSIVTVNSGEPVVHLSPDILTEDYVVDVDAIDQTAGVWFSGYGKNNDPEYEIGGRVAVNDSMGALPYGDYTLTEMRCAANEGLTLIERHFTVLRDGYLIDGGTATDDTIEITIGTTATDAETGTHYGVADGVETVSLNDVVKYDGVDPNKKYTMFAQLYDADTGEAIVDENGEEITKSIDFTADRTAGEVTVPFVDIPAELVNGKTIVVFETLYYKDGPIAVHQDLDDVDQMVSYPNIGTDATDSVTGTHEGYAGAADSTIQIKDAVDYSGLRPGTEYTVSGKLMDKGTGEAVKNADGNEITAETVFTPEEPSGTVEVVFDVPGGLLAGKTVVAFEELTADGVTVATHADIDDEQQTVYYPMIATDASDAADGDKTFSGSAQVTLNDTVNYANLEPGAEYEMRGTLMDKTTGSPVVDANGTPVTATQLFTPEAADGQMVMTFNFDVSNYVAHEIVVFEELYKNGNMVAAHSDINDAAQTVFVQDAGLADDLINEARLAQTGDTAAVATAVVVAVVAAAAIGCAVARRRSRK